MGEQSVQAEDRTGGRKNSGIMSEKQTIQQGYDELAETYASRRSVDERELRILTTFLNSLSEPHRILSQSHRELSHPLQ
jgi:hypothetical protein